MSNPAAASAAGSRSPKGQIHVKLISARGVNVHTAHARPYVVVEFEQNEFVSRDPIEETAKEIKGTATNMSRNTSSVALSALGAINIKAQALTNSAKAAEAAKRVKTAGAGSAASSASSGKSQLAGPANGSRTSSNGSGSSPTSSAKTGNTSPATLFGRLSAHNPVWKHEVTFDVTTDQSEITFTIYDRASEGREFLGQVQIKPVLKHDHTVDQWYKLQNLQEDKMVTGEMRVQITFEQSKTRRALTPRDFEFLKLVGRGTFGRVFQVRKRDTKRIYAMKVLSKKEIVAKKEVAHTIGERKILQRSLESPFLVGLKFSFQTELDLYLVTDFKSGGELFWHLQRETRFSEDRARFYIAELVLALEHLHKYNIVYRDLKPENILLDATGHVALCDFGLSKADLQSDQLTQTFCGTTEYLAPEVLLDEHGYSKLVDFWSLGVLLFEMCCGWSPFYAEDTQQMYKNICFGKIRFPKGVINDDGKQFVKGLLNRNPKHRLGAQRDTAELKEHPFFKDVDWKALAAKQVEPPFKPTVESDESVAYFDTEFTSADVREMGFGDDEEEKPPSLDENDPSEDWTSPRLPEFGVHLPNGPLGSDYIAGNVPPVPHAKHLGASLAGLGSQAKGIEIGKAKKKKEEVAQSMISNSMQENFKGFSFSGGESVHVPHSMANRLAQEKSNVEAAVADEELAEPTTEDEVDDDQTHGGRYANAKRRGIGFDEDV